MKQYVVYTRGVCRLTKKSHTSLNKIPASNALTRRNVSFEIGKGRLFFTTAMHINNKKERDALPLMVFRENISTNI